ncbi:hypothetical protein GCM10023216_11210 [Isoptericola chiayiensis]|uniref:Uncharacterized protein n=1 Tax=Isoptericola chiayiensis TaxID=579446 RepID=A0ABP8Y8N5_9MICO|nr:hypothetical protein [Isoptericola chiayiensis]NOW00758.1 hypothetical protein [Isoptericola chiayiensis]
MNDDELIRAMRVLAGRTPQVRVDVEEVLRAGRRRRARRAAGGVAVGGLLGVGLVVGTLAWADTTPAPDVVPAPAASTGVPAPDSTSDADDGWTTYPPSPDDGEHALVDHERGTIGLPEDDWVLSAEEQAAVDTAQQYLEIECLSDVGLGDEVEFVGPVPPYDERQRGLGLWTAEDLDRDYDVLVDRGAFWFDFQDDPRHLNDHTYSGVTPVPDDVLHGCYEDAEAAISGLTGDEFAESAWAGGTSGSPDLAVYLGTSFRSEATLRNLEPEERRVARQAREIVVEWEECLAEEGLEAMEAQAMVPAGVLDFEGAYSAEQREIMAALARWESEQEQRREIDEWPPSELGYTAEQTAFLDEPRPRPLLVGDAAERRRVVEVDVRCKQSLGTVQRLADLDATVQLAYIAEYPEYFESRREISVRMLANARDVLDEAGVEMP